MLPWYEYTQLQHLIEHSIEVPSTSGKFLPFEELMKATSLTNKGLISTIYGLLSSTPVEEFTPHQIRWHEDLTNGDIFGPRLFVTLAQQIYKCLFTKLYTGGI